MNDTMLPQRSATVRYTVRPRIPFGLGRARLPRIDAAAELGAYAFEVNRATGTLAKPGSALKA